MFDVYFFNFAKKENSTARPSTATGTKYECVINAATGLSNPVIGLGLAITSVPTFTYCYIAAFGRYYFINEWRWVGGKWEADLSCDVLATYKTEIGNSTMYVLRSASSYDGAIMDTLYPIKATYTPVYSPTATGYSNIGGWYTVGVVGKVTGSVDPIGGVTYMVMDATAFADFRDALFADDLAWYKADDDDPDKEEKDGGLAAIGDSLAKMIFDPFEYVRSCVWTPEKPFCYQATIGTDTAYNDWNVGFWNFHTDEGFYLLSYQGGGNIHPVGDYEYDIAIPKHPLAATRGKYLNTSPYSYYTFYAPGVGLVPLDASKLVDYSYISVKISFDVLGESGIVTIHTKALSPTSDELLLEKVSGNFVVPVNLAQSGTLNDVDISGITSTVQSAATGNIGGTIGGAISSINDIFQPKIQLMGANGGKFDLIGYPAIYAVHYDVADEDNSHHGRPLCQDVKINTLSGYVQCMDGDIDLDATPSERSSVQAYLVGGFFYE